MLELCDGRDGKSVMLMERELFAFFPLALECISTQVSIQTNHQSNVKLINKYIYIYSLKFNELSVIFIILSLALIT